MTVSSAAAKNGSGSGASPEVEELRKRFFDRLARDGAPDPGNLFTSMVVCCYEV